MALLRTEAALCLGQLGSLQPSCLPFVPRWQRNGPAPFDGGDVGDFDEGCDDYCDDFGELDDRHHVVDVAAIGEGSNCIAYKPASGYTAEECLEAIWGVANASADGSARPDRSSAIPDL